MGVDSKKSSKLVRRFYFTRLRGRESALVARRNKDGRHSTLSRGAETEKQIGNNNVN